MPEHGDAQLVAVQRFHIRLLYCDATVRAFNADPLRCLAAHAVNPSWQRLLPDIRSEGHLVEMRGRRFQAAQELVPAFRATFERLLDSAITPALVAGASWFREFLSSEEFFEPQWSLPHPSGVGRAYEGASRFFFWARRHFNVRDASVDLLLRDDLYLDFAARLDQLQVSATSALWRRFQRGSFWVRRPGTRGPCRGLTADRRVFSDSDTQGALQLGSRGLLDLDALEP